MIYIYISATALAAEGVSSGTSSSKAFLLISFLGTPSSGETPWERFPGRDSLGVPPWERLPGRASLGKLPWERCPRRSLPGKDLLGPGHPVSQGYPGMVA